MKHLLLLFLLPLFVYSQYCPSLGPNQLLPCGVNSTTLTADLSQCGPGGANPNQTTNYGVTNIPYVAQTNSGTQLFMGDDTQQGPFNIGFTFCYFGNTYTQFWVGSNGWISFSAGQPTTFTSAAIPNAGFFIPKNCILGPWQDWHPGVGGQIRYQVQGVAPCRKLVVSWLGVPMFGCTQTTGTFHIVIYESTNVIENHIQSKQFCNWANGTAVQGIHNLPGTIGIPVPGRNSTQWTTTNNAHRWTPSGPAVTPTLTWYQVGNPNPIGTGPTITVTPPPAGANYTCHFVYPTCNAGWSTCNNGQGGNLGPDTVFVQPGPPQLPPPIINTINPTCFQYCDGIIDVLPVGGSGVQTISWNGGIPNNFTPSSLCAGNYSFTITDANGCTVSGNATLIEPPIVTINPITGSDTVCYNSTVNPYGVTSVFPNLGYVWTNTIGNITAGQGTNQINLDFTGVNGGSYPNALSVIGVNQVGCQSLPQTFTITDLNILPVITPVGPFCEYDNCITLNATPSGGNFSGMNVWSDQYCPNNGFIGIDQVNYTYLQSGCVFDTSILTQVLPRPNITPVTNGIVDENNVYHEICEGDSITDFFDLVSVSGGFNQWYVFGDTITNNTLSMTWDTDGIFTFQGVRWDNGCVSNPQSFTASIELCPNEIFYIPNAFTPDGDERNNTFKPIVTSGVDIFNYTFVIYNRWGQIVWESFNPNMGWDGTYNNIPCQDGIYTWKLRFKVPKTDEIKEFKGSLTLIR
jgi:gliding motility-associated-like protein